MEEHDLHEDVFLESDIQLTAHALRNVLTLREEVIGGVLGAHITNGVNSYSQEDSLELVTVFGVDVVDFWSKDSVLEGEFNVQIQTIFGSAIDWRHCSSIFQGEVHSLDV